jgi:hypothetical protein
VLAYFQVVVENLLTTRDFNTLSKRNGIFLPVTEVEDGA